MVDNAITFGAAFVAGLLTFVSPCVLPLIPVFISFLTGVSYGDLAGGPAAAAPDPSLRRRTFLHVLAFVLGFTAVFVLLGASATAVGSALFRHQMWFMRVGGALVALFGLFLMGFLPLNFLQKDFRVHMRNKPAGFAGSFLVGATFGFGWTPCVGPILGSILLLASGADSLKQGVTLLLVYSAGLALPFLLAAWLLQGFLGLMRRLRGALLWIERLSGAFLFIVGLLVATGQFTRLTGWMLQAFEPWVDWLIKLGI